MTTAPIQPLPKTVEEPRIGRSLWGDAAVRLCRDKIALICLGVILVYALSALLAPMVLRGWKDNVHYEQANLDPCGQIVYQVVAKTADKPEIKIVAISSRRES